MTTAEGELSDAAPVKTGYLPREKGAIIVPCNDAVGLIEQAQINLGTRMKETRMGFFLDGKPVNTGKLLAAAGLKFKDAK